MRPSTPNFNFSQQAGPSSPPQTPTTSSAYTFVKSRRHGHVFTDQQIPASLENGGIVPTGRDNSFSYMPSPRAADLSPRSSTPDSVQSSACGSPPRSVMSSSPAPAPSPPRRPVRVAEGSFTIDEFHESDYEGYDLDENSVIHPHEYEDAPSDRASIRGIELDQDLYSGIHNLHCETDEVLDEADDLGFPDFETQREAWLLKMREEKRRKRRSSGSVQKRTLSQSIGSDTDDEDIQPVTFEGATSARRLRRKTESLIFDDPPPRIEEVEEPESCEELVDVDNDMLPDGFRELPYYYYVQEDMDLDSDD
ncbi:hypothetical protein HYFRA_00008670 [Hymenoscyphus fraxineus]|uniref:Uncharacterized protein n=1 Tax=Hymenoscyphus fraxineus TaxID=746836 RepID=A0A9N9PPS8_9HELO|nr:hypothetical protein HYFRA_00008670 [Hymenoscyphus fraxineus]